MSDVLSNRIKYLRQTGNYPDALLNELECENELPEYFSVSDIGVATITRTLQALDVDMKYVSFFAVQRLENSKILVHISQHHIQENIIHNTLYNRIHILKQTGNYPVALLNELERHNKLPEYFSVSDIGVATITRTLQALDVDMKYVNFFAPLGAESSKILVHISQHHPPPV